VRPEVAVQLVREFTYLYGAVCPHDGSSFFLVLPSPDRTCFQIFLNALAKKFQRYHLLVVIDGAPSHRDASLRSGLPSLSTDSVSPKLSFRFNGLKINLTG
jgi:hypothetical protein